MSGFVIIIIFSRMRDVFFDVCAVRAPWQSRRRFSWAVFLRLKTLMDVQY